MKAKEMFEELGFNKCEIIEKKGEYGECYPIEIKYYNNPDTMDKLYFDYEIIFNLSNNNNCGKHYCHSVQVKGRWNGSCNCIDTPLLQAINKQCEELGWLKDE